MSKIIDNYVLQNTIGQGQYGKVYKAYNIHTNNVVAVKVIKLERFKQVPKLNDFTINEINTLQMIKNENIIGFVEMMRTVNNIYLVYQFCNGGNLEELIHQRGFLKEEIALEYFGQLLNAFQTLVRENILHRDLKPSNILLHDGIIKIADFGFCKTLSGTMDLTQTMVGSPIYMAPEVLKGEPYSLSADIWSLGVCLYEMLFGKCPFEDHTIPRLMMQIQTKSVTIPMHIQKIGEGTEWLLKRMLTVDPQRRIQWQQLFEIYQKGKEASKNAKKDNVETVRTNPRSINTTPKKVNESSRTPPHNKQRSVSPDPRQMREVSPIAVRERGRSPVQPWIGASRSKASEGQNLAQTSNSMRYLNKQFESNRSQPSTNISNSVNRFQSSFQQEHPREKLLTLQTSSKNIVNVQAFGQHSGDQSKNIFLSSLTAKTAKDENPERLLPNKYSNGSSETTPQSEQVQQPSPAERIRWNLRILLLKRKKLVEQLQTLHQTLDLDNQEFVPLLPFLMARYIQFEVDELNSDMLGYQQPGSWEVLGSWIDFKSSQSYQKCHSMIQRDMQQLNSLMELFKTELRKSNSKTQSSKSSVRITIIDMATYPREVLKQQLLSEGLRYVESLYSKTHFQSDLLIRRKVEAHIMAVLQLLLDVGKWVVQEHTSIPQLIYQLKNLYVNF